MDSTVFKTVITGTLIFVVGQTLQNFVLKPIKDYKKIVGKIDNKLKFYANKLTNFGFNDKTIDEITDVMRDLSCSFESTYKQIPFRLFFSKMGVIANGKSVGKIAQRLIFLSNAGGRKDGSIEKCDEAINEIRKLLKITSIS